MHINSGSYSDFEFSVLKAHDTAPGNPDVVLFLKIAALYSNKFDDAKYIISKYEDNTVLTSSQIENFINIDFQVDNKPLYIYARAIQGLVSLKYRDYYYALNSFLEINPEVVPYLGLFTSLADLARYIVILAVIYLRRDEIKTKVRKFNNLILAL